MAAQEQHMAQMDHIKGRAWAEGVYEEKLANPKSLPNLGAGYSDALRAARAVQSIADRKLFTRPRGYGAPQDNPMPSSQRDFWRGVLARANELAVAEQQEIED